MARPRCYLRLLRRFAECSFLLVAVLFVALNASAQNTQPDLSGTWKLNASKSRWSGNVKRDSSDVLEIKHAGSKLTMRHSNGPIGGETYSYVTDGKEHLAYFLATHDPILAKAFWDGSTLVIEKSQQTKTANYPADVSSTHRYSLLDGGKSLAVTHKAKGTVVPGTYLDVELIYEKQ